LVTDGSFDLRDKRVGLRSGVLSEHDHAQSG
jgi:hypothetical protein